MFCPNFKCGSPLSVSTECESCGWKAPSVKTAKPIAFQVEKAEKAARSAARRAESDAHKAERKATRIEGEILEVTKEQIEGGRSYEKKTVVTMTDGRKYELDARFPSLNDKRTGELVESFSELDWVCVKEADVVEDVKEEVEEDCLVGTVRTGHSQHGHPECYGCNHGYQPCGYHAERLTFINLTPHEITVLDPVKEPGRHSWKDSQGYEDHPPMVVPAVGTVARVSTVAKDLHGSLSVVRYFAVEYGEVTGLPAPREGVAYIVSGMVLAALAGSGRHDVVAQGELIRDDVGQPIGCLGLRVLDGIAPTALFE